MLARTVQDELSRVLRKQFFLFVKLPQSFLHFCHRSLTLTDLSPSVKGYGDGTKLLIVQANE